MFDEVRGSPWKGLPIGTLSVLNQLRFHGVQQLLAVFEMSSEIR